MDVNGVTMYDMPVPQAAPVTPAAPSAPSVQQNTTSTPPPAEKKPMTAINAEMAEKQTENPATKEAVEKTISQINKAITAFDREMHVSVHEKTQRIMVKVMDTVENKVIREIPPEKVLDAFARTLELAGILVDKRS